MYHFNYQQNTLVRTSLSIGCDRQSVKVFIVVLKHTLPLIIN